MNFYQTRYIIIKILRRKLRKLLISLALAAYASAIQLDQTLSIEDDFNAWASTYNKSYKDVIEWQERFSIWVKNQEEIAQIN